MYKHAFINGCFTLAALYSQIPLPWLNVRLWSYFNGTRLISVAVAVSLIFRLTVLVVDETAVHAIGSYKVFKHVLDVLQ